MEARAAHESDDDTQEYSMEPPLKKFKSTSGSGIDNETPTTDSDTSTMPGLCPNGQAEEQCTGDEPDEEQIQGDSEIAPKQDIHVSNDSGRGEAKDDTEHYLCRTESLESGGFEASQDVNFDVECDNSEDTRDSLHSGGFEITELENDNGVNEKTSKTTLENSVSVKSPVSVSSCVTSSAASTNSPAAGTSSKSCLYKESSIARDAENISAMFGLDAVDSAVYQRLKQLRSKGNRTDIVTNEILEHGLESLKESLNEKDEDDSGIFDEMDTVKSRLVEKLPEAKVDPDEIYTLLEASGDEDQRVNNVVDQLLKRYGESPAPDQHLAKALDTSQSSNQSGDSDIIRQVQVVLKDLPGTDPNVIYDLLEANSDMENCVETVVSILKQKAQWSVGGGDCPAPPVTTHAYPSHPPGGSDFAHNHLYNDMNMVATMFPNKDKNEIFAYLEAHFHQPNRVQLVTEELLRIEQENQATDNPTVITPDRSTGGGTNNAVIVTGRTNPRSIIQLQQDVEMLKKIFPDCDPNYFFENLESMSNDPDRVDRLSSSMFDKGNYPKLKDRLETEKRNVTIRRLQNMELNIEEYLQMFPDPEEVFYDISKAISGSYREHTAVQLQNDFPMLSIKYIDKKLEEHRGHLLPTYMDLDRVAEKYRQDRETAVREHKRFLYTPRPGIKRMPDVPDELFYKELLFVKNEQRIKDFIKDRADAKVLRREEARERGEFYECTCCYDDEVLFEDMLACPEGHLFCKECVRRQAEENIGQAKVKFPCLEGECDKDFNMPSLQTVLSSKSFSILLRRIQEEEIRQADIDDLISCPFCSFATIMSNPDDKIFKCLNPECLKESCRLCQEPNHIPLRCEEVEKETEKNMRAYIEGKMTEAMIRVCWQCNKRFYKIEGCNKMTCTCGAHMCYVCREPIKGYDHFNHGQCSNVENADKLHQKEMEKAAAEARAQYEKDHPEAVGTSLKHDPVKLLSHSEQHHNNTITDYADNDSEDEEDDYGDSDVSSSEYEDEEYLY